MAQLKTELLARSLSGVRRTFHHSNRHLGEAGRNSRQTFSQVKREKRQARVKAVGEAIASGVLSKDFVVRLIRELLDKK